MRSFDIRADKLSTTNILLAMRVKDLPYSANLPLSGELKGEIQDAMPLRTSSAAKSSQAAEPSSTLTRQTIRWR